MEKDICQYRALFAFAIYFQKSMKVTSNTCTSLRVLLSPLNTCVTSASFRISRNQCFQ